MVNTSGNTEDLEIVVLVVLFVVGTMVDQEVFSV